MLSVGDPSGDLHAANLMRAIRRAMWLHNLLRLGHYRRRLEVCMHRLDAGDVSMLVPVDFGGFNLCLCRQAARRGVPVFYYIPPQVWAHGRYRLKKLRKWTTRCGLIYPFETDLYRQWGVAAEYVGHPLFDEIAQHPPSDDVVRGLRRRFGENLVALFPGSRRQEVRAHAQVLADACREIRRAVPDVAFATLCPERVRSLVAKLLPEYLGVQAVDDATPIELARASRLCIAKSGTITLEIATQGVPTVIFYRALAFAAFMGYGLADVPYMGLVNNLAGRMVCPEKLMVRPDPRWVAGQALRLLRDPEAYEENRRDIAATLDGFAEPGASDRAARSALELIA